MENQHITSLDNLNLSWLFFQSVTVPVCAKSLHHLSTIQIYGRASDLKSRPVIPKTRVFQALLSVGGILGNDLVLMHQ